MEYRRPRGYVPPYNYCDRWCGRCGIDKARCLLYQTEEDERLHREIDGLGEPSAEEQVERMMKDARLAIRLVEEQAREMGVDLTEAKEAPAAPPPEPDPIVGEATALARGVALILRRHASALGPEAEVLRHHHILVGPKLGRATRPAPGEEGVAEAILQAQVADRALAALAAALEAARARDPRISDDLIDVLAMIQALRREVASRWLGLPCALLEPAPAGEWWGPLRDITPTLRHLRR